MATPSSESGFASATMRTVNPLNGCWEHLDRSYSTMRVTPKIVLVATGTIVVSAIVALSLRKQYPPTLGDGSVSVDLVVLLSAVSDKVDLSNATVRIREGKGGGRVFFVSDSAGTVGSFERTLAGQWTFTPTKPARARVSQSIHTSNSRFVAALSRSAHHARVESILATHDSITFGVSADSVFLSVFNELSPLERWLDLPRPIGGTALIRFADEGGNEGAIEIFGGR